MPENPPVHSQHETQAKKVHNIVATHVVPQEKAHEVSQVATVSEFDRTGEDKSSRVVQGPLVELDAKVHTEVAVVYVVPGRDDGEVMETDTMVKQSHMEFDRTGVETSSRVVLGVGC